MTLEEVEKHCKTFYIRANRCILTNDYGSSMREIVEFYNLCGGKERIFDDMNNGFGWDRLPKSFIQDSQVKELANLVLNNL